MSDWSNVDFFTPQGWQCPICKRVYSPTTPMCYYCGDGNTVLRTTVGSEVIDLYHESVTKAEKPEERR